MSAMPDTRPSECDLLLPPPTLDTTPIRPTSGAHVHELNGDHVVVTREWYDTNEQQLRHLTAACLSAEREVIELKAWRDAVRTAVRQFAEDAGARVDSEIPF